MKYNKSWLSGKSIADLDVLFAFLPPYTACKESIFYVLHTAIGVCVEQALVLSVKIQLNRINFSIHYNLI